MKSRPSLDAEESRHSFARVFLQIGPRRQGFASPQKTRPRRPAKNCKMVLALVSMMDSIRSFPALFITAREIGDVQIHR
jgi:hypothetical protein